MAIGGRGRPRKDILRLEIPAETAEIIEGRVASLVPQAARLSWKEGLLDLVILSAYVQGAMDALWIAERHPKLIQK